MAGLVRLPRNWFLSESCPGVPRLVGMTTRHDIISSHMHNNLLYSCIVHTLPVSFLHPPIPCAIEPKA